MKIKKRKDLLEVIRNSINEKCVNCKHPAKDHLEFTFGSYREWLCASMIFRPASK